jgi:nitronate monooxygenase
VSGAGLPLSLPKYVEKYKVSEKEKPALIPIVSSVRALDIILRAWKGFLPAAICVETPNTAGGHLGVTKVEDIGKEEFSLEVVVPALVKYLKERNLDIPIIAAGGIWNRKDIDHMLKIGASGVQIATRFLTTTECNASKEFKERHLYNKDPIVIIKSPVGMPGRAIENNFIREVSAGKRFNLGPCVECLRGCEYHQKGTGYCIIRALDNVRRGDVENGVLFTGTNGNRLEENEGIVPVSQVMKKLIQKEN